MNILSKLGYRFKRSVGAHRAVSIMQDAFPGQKVWQHASYLMVGLKGYQVFQAGNRVTVEPA